MTKKNITILFPPTRRFLILADRTLGGVAPASFIPLQYGLYLLRKIARQCQYGYSTRGLTTRERELAVASISDFVYYKQRTKNKRFGAFLILCEQGVRHATRVYPERYDAQMYYEEIIRLIDESMYDPEKMSCFFEGMVASLEEYARTSVCA